MNDVRKTSPLPTLRRPLADDQHPALVYLARLGVGSRRTMAEALETIAGLLTDRRADATKLNWSELRYQHTAAIRATLAERYSFSERRGDWAR